MVAVLNGCGDGTADTEQQTGVIDQALTEESGSVRMMSALAGCGSSVQRLLDADAATLANEDYNPPFQLTDNGMTFWTDVFGEQGKTSGGAAAVRAWRSDVSFGGSSKSLAVETNPCATSCTDGKQKLMYKFLRSDPNRSLTTDPASRVRRYLGFAIRVSGDIPRYDEPPLLAQFWQGDPHAPPFMARLERQSSTAMDLVFYTRDNDSGSSPSQEPEWRGSIENFQRDEWYQVRINALPEHVDAPHQLGSTTIQVKCRGPAPCECSDPNATDCDSYGWHEVFDFHGDWTYVEDSCCQYDHTCDSCSGNPSSTDCPAPSACSEVGAPAEEANERVDLLLGIYYPSGETGKHIAARFDNVKLGTTASSVDPEVACTWTAP
jgi:hypothetical protein